MIASAIAARHELGPTACLAPYADSLWRPLARISRACARRPCLPASRSTVTPPAGPGRVKKALTDHCALACRSYYVGGVKLCARLGAGGCVSVSMAAAVRAESRGVLVGCQRCRSDDSGQWSLERPEYRSGLRGALWCVTVLCVWRLDDVDTFVIAWSCSCNFWSWFASPAPPTST